ncbi:MAG: formylglycine-generating enzyme family protein [Verrucomicrobia bacterium]|nr:formylglycine-generating enzyme family protein [Verrucomicrobiota bacterium]
MKHMSWVVPARIGCLLFLMVQLAAFSETQAQTKEATLQDAIGTVKQLSVDLGGGVKMEFVEIRPGAFQMGSAQGGDETAHKVTLTKPYYLGKYEMTQEQWQAVMGNNPSNFKDPKKPVDSVSWDDCQNFLAKLNEKIATQKFSLPTEAQWKYASRAGGTGEYGFGNDETDLGAYAWYSNNANSTTHPVGEKKPNAWGLYDMHGNVWEWCADWHANYQGNAETDPVGAASGSGRVLRGGSWSSPAALCRCALRTYIRPASRSYLCGLRLVVGVR